MRTKIFLTIFVLGLLLAAVTPVAASADPTVASSSTWHRVARGETLYSIGRHYNVHPNAIADANRLHSPSRIYVGQHLRIPAGPPYPWPGRPPEPCGIYHTVRYGENLFRIGLRYGVSPWRIARANGIFNIHRIWAGQRLLIPCH